MYKPFEGGSEVILQDDGNLGKKGSLAVKAYLPPKGKGHYYNLYFDFDTGKRVVDDSVKEIEVLNGDLNGPDSRLNDDECMWTRPIMPWNRKVYKLKIAKEKIRQEHDPQYIDQELEDYREQEWFRREYGVEFWNYNPITKKHQYE